MESELATTLERSFKRRKHSQEMINDAGTDNEVENVGVLEVLSTGLFDIFDCFGDTILPFYASRPSFLDYYI